MRWYIHFILIVYMGGIYVYIDCVYGVVHTCLSESRTLIYTDICHSLLWCILMMYKGGIYMYIDYVYAWCIYMYIDCVHGWYIHVYWLCIWGDIYVYMDGVYGWYIHIDGWCIWVVYTYIWMVYMDGIYMYIDCVYGVVYKSVRRQNFDLIHHMSRSLLCSIVCGEKWSFVLWLLSFFF
jgi:hypothetical protein